MKFASFKNALADRPLLGFCSMYASPGIIERIGQDWDWCWIDAQHGEWGLETTVQAVRACNLTGIFALVRAPGREAGILGRLLDTACHAIMVPMVDDGAQAAAVVQAACFAPRGSRSYGGRRLCDLYGRAYAHPDQPQPLVICQIESPAAIERVDEIAATDGVDGLFFGPDDMALARGIPMDMPRPPDFMAAEMQAVATAALRHNKIAGGIFRSPQTLRQAVAWGYRLVVCSGDVPLLSHYSQESADVCRAALGDQARNAVDGPAALY